MQVAQDQGESAKTMMVDPAGNIDHDVRSATDNGLLVVIALAMDLPAYGQRANPLALLGQGLNRIFRCLLLVPQPYRILVILRR